MFGGLQTKNISWCGQKISQSQTKIESIILHF